MTGPTAEALARLEVDVASWPFDPASFTAMPRRPQDMAADLRLALDALAAAPNLDAGVVGDLVEALEDCVREMETPGEHSDGAYQKARDALAKYATQGTGGAS